MFGLRIRKIVHNFLRDPAGYNAYVPGAVFLVPREWMMGIDTYGLSFSVEHGMILPVKMPITTGR